MQDVQGAGDAGGAGGGRIPSSQENLLRTEGQHTPRETLAIKEFKTRKYF